jgi:hypothetical protein
MKYGRDCQTGVSRMVTVEVLAASGNYFDIAEFRALDWLTGQPFPHEDRSRWPGVRLQIYPHRLSVEWLPNQFELQRGSTWQHFVIEWRMNRTPTGSFGSYPHAFRCVCGKNVHTILCRDRYGCKHCLVDGGARYSCASVSPLRRAWRHAVKIRTQLGDSSGNVGGAWPLKPMGMRKTRYDLLLMRLQKVEGRMPKRQRQRGGKLAVDDDFAAALRFQFRALALPEKPNREWTTWFKTNDPRRWTKQAQCAQHCLVAPLSSGSFLLPGSHALLGIFRIDKSHRGLPALCSLDLAPLQGRCRTAASTPAAPARRAGRS